MDVKDVQNLLAAFKKQMKQDVSDLVGKSVSDVMRETKKRLESQKANTVQTASAQQQDANSTEPKMPIVQQSVMNATATQPQANATQSDDEAALKDAFEDSMKLMH